MQLQVFVKFKSYLWKKLFQKNHCLPQQRFHSTFQPPCLCIPVDCYFHNANLLSTAKKENLFMINCFCCIKPLASLLNSNWVSQEKKKEMSIHKLYVLILPYLCWLTLIQNGEYGAHTFHKKLYLKSYQAHTFSFLKAKECQKDSANISVCTYLCAYMNFTKDHLSFSLQLKRLCFQVCFLFQVLCPGSFRRRLESYFGRRI